MRPIRACAFSLARSLGVIDPDAMLAAMPLRLFHEWLAFMEYESSVNGDMAGTSGRAAEQTPEQMVGVLNMAVARQKEIFKRGH